jgi:hypothetical protein
MADRFIDFMVSATGSVPRTLHESIRLLANASSGFCRSWNSGDLADAQTTSQEAFGLFDHILNELIRHRDDRRGLATWTGSPLQVALSARVGDLIEPTTSTIESTFTSQPMGSGAIPNGAGTSPLRLDAALNKLKHRNSNNVNFTVSTVGMHHLYILTRAGSGRPNSISSFDVQAFCEACRVAANAV